MWKSGALDPSLALELLGQAQGANAQPSAATTSPAPGGEEQGTQQTEEEADAAAQMAAIQQKKEPRPKGCVNRLSMISSFCSTTLFICLEPQDENAIKARLRRMLELRRKNGELPKGIPQWLHDAWKSGDHLEMAKQLRDCNWDKAGGQHSHHVHVASTICAVGQRRRRSSVA